jgi:hypothetical protein
MPKFNCSYAYDIACFADFVVEAKSELAARRKIEKALREGRFEKVTPNPCWETGATNERVLVHGPRTRNEPAVTLEELVGDKHRVSTMTGRCVRCGISADDDTVENTPCIK